MDPSWNQFGPRATRGELPWQQESQFVIPAAEKDNLPHASEGNRLEPSKHQRFNWVNCPNHKHLSMQSRWNFNLPALMWQIPERRSRSGTVFGRRVTAKNSAVIHLAKDQPGKWGRPGGCQLDSVWWLGGNDLSQGVRWMDFQIPVFDQVPSNLPVRWEKDGFAIDGGDPNFMSKTCFFNVLN